MQPHEQNLGNRRHRTLPLTRRLVLRIRCARPEHASGQRSETTNEPIQPCSGL